MIPDFVIKLLMPQLNKLGSAMIELDAKHGTNDLCFMISKKAVQKHDKEGKPIFLKDGKPDMIIRTFMSWVEKPNPQHLSYVKKEDGQPMVMGIEGLITMLTGGNNKEE